MFVFQVAREQAAKKDVLKLAPQPTSVMLREKALNFLDDFVKAVNKSASEALDLLTIAPGFRVTLSRGAYRKLGRAWSMREETAFLLFEDPKTHVIVQAIEDPEKEQTEQSFGFEWEFVKKTVTEMRAKGLEFAGTYHSHTKPSEEHPDYDHSLPSPDDVNIFPHWIHGSSGNDREDPDYRSITESNRLLLVGTRKNGAFGIRAFAPIEYDKAIKASTHRQETPLGSEEYQEVLREGDERGLFTKHYDKLQLSSVRIVEFELEAKRE